MESVVVAIPTARREAVSFRICGQEQIGPFFGHIFGLVEILGLPLCSWGFGETS